MQRVQNSRFQPHNEPIETLLQDDAAAIAPVAVHWATGTIELMSLAGVDCHEPFFQQTIRRVVTGQSPARVEISFERYARAVPRNRPAPNGFLFHTGRCGSTLLANMLTASGRYFVLREPGTVIDLSSAWLDAGDDVARTDVESAFRLIVPQLLWAAGRAARFRILKPSAWNIQAGGVLLHLFPAAPAVFLYRNPRETVASMLFEPPGWFDWITSPRAAQARYLPSLRTVPADSAVSEVVFFAHAWRSAVEAALELPGERLLLLDYADLMADPSGALARVVAHFGDAAEADIIMPMLAARAIYSKDPEGKEPFDPNQRHRRPLLTAQESVAIEAVTSDAAEKLAIRSRCARG
jgi:hypothetical protein